jgi:hypothetical protein
MDKVRFGRALGYGARHAAKALTQAVDAATTPSASSAARPPATEPPRPARPVSQTVADAGRSVFEAHRTVQQSRSQATSQIRNAAKIAGKSALAPVAKFSSVLWLEVTGTFFGLIAFVMGEAVYKLRASFHLPPSAPDAQKLYLYIAMFLVFLYFTVSSFVRASRRQRQ